MAKNNDAVAVQEAILAFRDALSDYKYADFIESDAPYTLLDAATTQEMRIRFESMLEKYAQECGVPLRTVRAILKAKQQEKPSSQIASGGWFDFPGQPIALQCGKYVVDGGRICLEEKNGLEVVCTHPIIPTKRYINIETQTESLEISFKREYWKSVMVERGKLASASTIVQLADHGVSVTSESARQMVKYLSYVDDLNRDIIPIEKMSSHLGWIDDSFVPYTDGIQYDGQGQFLQMYKTIHECGSFDDWLSIAKEVRASGCVQARIMMAASFASVLVQKFDALPFFVHLWSMQSGTGKTVAMELAASIWANPVVGAYCRSLKSTTVGLEQLAIFTCNLPLCLDELQSIQNRSGFDDIIYGLCEGTGKTRGARNGGLRNSPTWKNCILTTGEQPIVGSGSKAGAMNRVIEVECKSKVLPDAKRVHDTIAANYGFAGREFIKAIADPDAWKSIDDDRKQIFDTLCIKGTDKQALSASILLAADHAAEKLIFRDGITLTEDDIIPYIWSESDVDSGRRAHEYLMDWIAENRGGFVVNNDTDSVRNRSVLGCAELDDDGNAKKIWIIGKIFNQALSDGGFSPDSYLSWLQAEGILQTDKGNKKITKRIPGLGTTARCVCLLFNSQEQFGTILHDVDLPW